jgi:nitrile hydratase
MATRFDPPEPGFSVALATGEAPIFGPGDRIRILTRSPIGHYRVPTYLRGKRGAIEAVIEPAAVDNEEEGFGRNAGSKRHYYRVAVPMTEIWADYAGSSRDGLRVEIFETWLERI